MGSTVYRLKSEKETVTDMHRHTRGKTETLINRQIQDLKKRQIRGQTFDCIRIFGCP